MLVETPTNRFPLVKSSYITSPRQTILPLSHSSTGLTHVFALTDSYVSIILRVCTNLRTLKVILYPHYSIYSLRSGLPYLIPSYLMSIPTCACAFKIASNPQLSQQSLCLIRQLTHIEHVDLFESRGVTDEVMVALAQCTQLKVLKIDACRRISDAGTLLQEILPLLSN